MDKEKIIMILLLITILLSIGSIIFTLVTGSNISESREIRNIEESEASGTASFEIVTPNGGTG